MPDYLVTHQVHLMETRPTRWYDYRGDIANRPPPNYEGTLWGNTTREAEEMNHVAGTDGKEPATKKPMAAWSMVKSWWRNYCESSTIHGFKYLVTPNRPAYERIYWVLAILGVHSAVWLVIGDQLEQFSRSPVVFSMESEPTPVSSIPFPAVTFCPETQARPSMFSRARRPAKGPHAEDFEKQRLDYLLWVCPSKNTGKSPGAQRNVYNSSYIQTIFEETHGIEGCRKTVLEIKWQTEKLNEPCDHVQPMATDAGACFTFNMLPLDHVLRRPDSIVKTWGRVNATDDRRIWNPDEGYRVDRRKANCTSCQVPPWNTWGNGVGHGLAIRLDFIADDYDQNCGSGSKGFFVYVHNPSEVPGDSHSVSYLDLDRINFVQVRPKVYTVDERLKKWKPKERGCYYQRERRLSHFKIYTQRNCDLECEANATLKKCGCVSKHHPRLPETPVCGKGLSNCVLSETTDNDFCQCLPSCSELEYEISTAQFQATWSQNDWIPNASQPVRNGTSNAVLQVIFRNRYTIATRRNIMFGYSDLVANMGGLLGLFLGFSLLSLFELFYFMFVEPLQRLGRLITQRNV